MCMDVTTFFGGADDLPYILAIFDGCITWLKISKRYFMTYRNIVDRGKTKR